MELKELLVKLSQNDYVIKVFKNNFGYNYEVKKLGDNPIGSRFSIVTNKDETACNLFWDNPTGTMHYDTYEDVFEYLVNEKCNGRWKAWMGRY